MVDLKRRVYALFKRDIYLVLLSALIISSCSHLTKMPMDNPRTSALVHGAINANDNLKTVKGIGRLRFTTEDSALTARIAWAAHLPDKIRIDVVTPLGQSSPMVIADGHTVTFFSEGNTARHLKQRKNVLEPIVGVPVGIEFLAVLLAGRLPPPSYVATQMTSNETHIADIELLDRWSMIVGRLTTDPTTQKPLRYSHYGADGMNQYQISWRKWEVIQSFSLPGDIEIKTAGGEMLSLQIDRFICNTEMADDLFITPLAD